MTNIQLSTGLQQILLYSKGILLMKSSNFCKIWEDFDMLCAAELPGMAFKIVIPV